ncbi:ankyrin-3 [Chiloscyllium plagiosum]|uniref:ankyrin-3 n=1 Tax=Chiloscyllium plagiosum TaxID=36176 RepID=UPI001CB83C1C|nr:ankyrin-3 [Chiloscyllium plagiosum]
MKLARKGDVLPPRGGAAVGVVATCPASEQGGAEKLKQAHRWNVYLALMDDGGYHKVHEGASLYAHDQILVFRVSVSFKTFTTVITNEFQESARAEVISKMFFEQFINPKTKYEIDLAFLETLLQQGANINFKDVNGCTVLHEVARNWHVDIAIFLVEQGADVNQTDVFGRTALHVAAAANNVEMIKFLIQEKANVDQVSDGDMLTPMHCAAKHDALEAVVCLYEHHASIHRKDARKRTPLFLAAANGYSRTAIMLLKFGASATVEDNSGFSCLMEMIIKMPTVLAISDFECRKILAKLKQLVVMV